MKRMVALVAPLLLAQVAHAGIACEVNLAGRLGADADGTLYVDMRDGGIVGVCSLSATSAAGVTRETCTAWYASMLTYKANHGRAVLYFDPVLPGNSNLTTCANLGDWTRHQAYFFHSI